MAVGLGIRGTWGMAVTASLVTASAVRGRNEPPRYRAESLRCTAFSETIRTHARSVSGQAIVQSDAGRSGLLVVAARDTAGQIVIDAWYDSLAVYRESSGLRETPETDGFLGGRYRGSIGSDGRYAPIRDPFVPDELAEVADLTRALDDFLPRVPRVALEVGKSWSDSGLTIRRLPDASGGPGVTQRYQWTATGRRGDRYPAADSQAVTLDQAVEETGDLVWSPADGPLTWARTIRITARIPATGGVKRAVRSTVQQEITVVRRYDITPSCR